jgi:hypothetical protein
MIRRAHVDVDISRQVRDVRPKPNDVVIQVAYFGASITGGGACERYRLRARVKSIARAPARL